MSVNYDITPKMSKYLDPHMSLRLMTFLHKQGVYPAEELLPEIVELNIGHFLMGVAIFTGLDEAIISMRSLMEKARQS